MATEVDFPVPPVSRPGWLARLRAGWQTLMLTVIAAGVALLAFDKAMEMRTRAKYGYYLDLLRKLSDAPSRGDGTWDQEAREYWSRNYIEFRSIGLRHPDEYSRR